MADIRVDIELKSGEKYSINNGRIDSLSSLTQSNSDASTIFYGVLSNTGSIDVADVNEEIKNLVEDGQIDYSGVKLDIFANDKQVQSHITGDSGYQDNLLNLNLTDDLSNLSTVIYSNPDESNYLSDITGLDLLIKICQKCNPQLNVPISGSNNIPYTETDMLNVYEYLNMIKFKDIDLSLDNMNAQDLLNNFCSATQLNIFNGNDGNDVVIESRPVVSGVDSYHNISNKPIMVKNENIFDEGPSSLFLKNKIKQVNIPVLDVITKNKTIESIVPSEIANDIYGGLRDHSIYNKTVQSIASIDKEMVAFFQDWHIYKEVVSEDEYIQLKNKAIIHAEYGSTHQSLLNFTELQVYPTLNDFYNHLKTINTEASSFITHFSVGILGNDIYNKQTKGISIVYALFFERFMPDMFPFSIWIGSGYNNSKDLNMVVTKKNEITKTISSSQQIIKKDSIFEINKNNLLTSTSVITVDGEEKPLYDYIAKNILYDYFDGIKTKKIKISCNDLCYTHNKNQVAKIWSSGEILNVGDIINLETEKYRDGSYINWKITGREFNFKGEPLLSAELQECIPNTSLTDYKYGLYQKNNQVYSWKELVQNKLVTVNNGTLISVSKEMTGTLIIDPSIASIFGSAFDSSLLDSIILPNSLIEIGSLAFVRCKNLKEVTIPSSVNVIQYGAFRLCTSLESVYISYGVGQIEGSVFSDCSNLQEVYIPDTVTSIGTSAFYNCSSLQHLYIPSSVQEMGRYGSVESRPFYKCSPSLVLYCGSSSKPEGFPSSWNLYDFTTNPTTPILLTAKYGYTREQYESEVQ